MKLETRTRRGAALLGFGFLLSILAACSASPPGDKAGGGDPPLTLRLGTPDGVATPGSATLVDFAARVADLSSGRVTVSIVWHAAGTETDFEAAIIRDVRKGMLDLGWVGTRAWDTQGISAFQALQAPFLISSYPLLNKVLTSSLVGKMLSGLEPAGLIGLRLYPDQIRYPLGFRNPFVSLHDFAGAKIRVPTSNASDDLIRALGAVPAHLNGLPLNEAVANGDLAGAESSPGSAAQFPPRSFLTMNLPIYPKISTLFAATVRFESLSATVQAELRAAAEQTLSAALVDDPETADLGAFCQAGGGVAMATDSDLREIITAAAVVTRGLEADASTSSYLKQIESMKAMVPAATRPPVPAACPT